MYVNSQIKPTASGISSVPASAVRGTEPEVATRELVVLITRVVGGHTAAQKQNITVQHRLGWVAN